MRNLFVFVLLLLSIFSSAQTSGPRFSKYPIGESTVQIYFPSQPGEVYVDYSPDSSMVYTVECTDSSTGQDFQFGAIVVNLKDEIEEDLQEELLVSYLDYLKESFNIESAAGYGKGHTLTTHESAKGIIDLWEDEDLQKWEITGWIAENTIVVLFEYGPDEYPNKSVIEIFMKGVRFSGD